MSHSLLHASSRTHLKIVVLALVGAILVVLTGIAAHVSANGDVARLQTQAPVVKAGQPASYTDRGSAAIR
jgi:hypothetical protein